MKKEHKPGAMLMKYSAKHKKDKIKGKNWIAGAIKKPGALHAQLGIKKGTKIPAGTLKRAAGKGGKLGQRARLAETLKGMKHKKGMKNDHDKDDKKKGMKKKSDGFKAGTDMSTAVMHKKMKMCAKCGKKHMAGKHMKKKHMKKDGKK